MIKKLRFQIAFTVSLVLSLVLAVILFMVNILSYSSTYAEAYELMELIAADNGETGNVIGDEPSSKFYTYRNAQFYSVFFEHDGSVVMVKNEKNSEYTDDELVKICEAINKSGSFKGTYGKFVYAVGVFFGGRSVVIMDNSVNIQNIRTVRHNSVLIGCIGILIIGWMAFAVSDWIVYPVKQAYEKQKQFISDVSHELKTPIAVISANAEVLEDEVGENKWLDYIKSESDRMNGLVKDLLMLSRLDASAEQKKFVSVNMSKVVEGTAMPFEVIAFDKKIGFDCNVEENISVMGEEDKLKQVVVILIDNAIKHTDENGSIEVKLYSVRTKAVLEVINTGAEIPKENRDKIFERFYRVDEARNSEKGGHGLGLAIAKSIVDRHKGNISVDCANGKTKFKVII